MVILCFNPKIHNCILQPDVDADGDDFVKGTYSGLASILRKCINRVKYVVADSTRNEVQLCLNVLLYNFSNRFFFED